MARSWAARDGAGGQPRPPFRAARADADTLGGLPELLAKGWLGLVEQGAIGFVIAMLARCQLAGIGAGIALYFVEQFSAIVLRDAVRYLPFSVSGSLIQTSG